MSIISKTIPKREQGNRGRIIAPAYFEPVNPFFGRVFTVRVGKWMPFEKEASGRFPPQQWKGDAPRGPIHIVRVQSADSTYSNAPQQKGGGLLNVIFNRGGG